MMKAIFITIVLLLLPLLAIASEHQVKRGGTLVNIAATYDGLTAKQLYQANKLMIDQRNHKLSGAQKFWVYPGQKLQIPACAKKSAAKATSKIASVKHSNKRLMKRNASGWAMWKVAGGDKFGRRDSVKALNLHPKFNDEAKKALVELYGQTSAPCEVKSGQQFGWVLFGNYKWQEKVAWVGKKTLKAECWPETKIGDELCELSRTEVCSNFEITCKPLPTPPPVFPPISSAKSPPPVFPPISSAKLPPPPVIPPVVVISPPVIPPIVIPPVLKVVPIEPKACVFKPSYEAFGFYGNYHAVEGHSNYQYYGMDGSFFPSLCNVGKENFRVGISAGTVGWDGHSGSSKILGNKEVVGPVLKLNSEERGETTLKVRFGEKHEQTTNGAYRGNSEAQILNTELYHDFPPKPGASFRLSQIGAAADFDLGGKKTSNYNGTPISRSVDPRHSASEFKGWARINLHEGTNFTPYVEGQIMREQGFHNTSVEPKLGAKFWQEAVDLNVAYKANVQGPNTDAWGINSCVDIGKTVNRIRSWLAE